MHVCAGVLLALNMELRFLDRLDVLQAVAATLQSLLLTVLGLQACFDHAHPVTWCWGLNSGQVLKLMKHAVTHSPTSMQDGELALLHRSLANPAEMNTSHPSLTQANTPSSLIQASAS